MNILVTLGNYSYFTMLLKKFEFNKTVLFYEIIIHYYTALILNINKIKKDN